MGAMVPLGLNRLQTIDPLPGQFPYSVMLFTDGTNYYTENGQTGEVEEQDSTSTAGFQEALDIILAQNGGRLFVKRGVYRISTPIVYNAPGPDYALSAPLQISGEVLENNTDGTSPIANPPGGVDLVATSVFPSGSFILNINQGTQTRIDSIRVENLNFIGNQSLQVSGFYLNNPNQGLVLHCHFAALYNGYYQDSTLGVAAGEMTTQQNVFDSCQNFAHYFAGTNNKSIGDDIYYSLGDLLESSGFVNAGYHTKYIGCHVDNYPGFAWVLRGPATFLGCTDIVQPDAPASASFNIDYVEDNVVSSIRIVAHSQEGSPSSLFSLGGGGAFKCVALGSDFSSGTLATGSATSPSTIVLQTCNLAASPPVPQIPGLTFLTEGNF